MSYAFTQPGVTLAYESLLVPRLFAPWSEVLLDAADPHVGEAVLDVATGPGTVARAAARRVGPTGRVTAIDISRLMLDLARGKRREPTAAPIDWIEAPAAPLPVPSGDHDLVTCQQVLQFFPDRPAALAEMRRAIRPGGRVALAVWAELDRSGVFAALHAALVDTGHTDLAAELLPPWSMPERQALVRALASADFVDIRVEQATLGIVFEGGLEQAAAVFTATPLAPALAALPDPERAAVMAAAARRLAPMLDGSDGAVRVEMTSNVGLARRGR